MIASIGGPGLGAGVLKCFVVNFCRHQGRVVSYV
jgi:hypothetical protein